MKFLKIIITLFIAFFLVLILAICNIPSGQRHYYRDKEIQKQQVESNNNLYKESVQHNMDIVTVIL